LFHVTPARGASAADREERVIRSVIGSTRPAAGALALLLGLTFSVPPATAAGSEAKVQAPRAGIRAAAAARLAQIDTRQAVRATQDKTDPGTSDNRSFFHTSRGVAVLVLMAAGVGYMIYSTKHDDVKRSPCREDKPGCVFP
jgi:hypothetical protein